MDPIPRRMSVADADLDWDLVRRLTVSVDGVPQDRVISYDIDKGAVIKIKVDAEGQMITDPAGEQMAIETVRGTVTVSPKGVLP